MRVLIAAGGTGGHIYPGIAVANEILRREPKSQVRFVGTAPGLENKLVPQAGFELSIIDSAGLKNVGPVARARGVLVLPKSFLAARTLLKAFRPDVVIGAGGYVSGPVVLTATLQRLPTLVMESNALPGWTNRVLARFVDKAAVSFDAALPFFRGKAVVTGNPVRREFFEIPRRERNATGVAQFSLLVFGGSQGAHKNPQPATRKIDDPASPLTKAFEGQEFLWTDEYYRMVDTGLQGTYYSRDKLHVLLSVDFAKSPDFNAGRAPFVRQDNDYAVCWIKGYGKGRVFFNSLGHTVQSFTDPKMNEFLLAAVQFMLGDLPAEIAFCLATGNTARMRALDCGIIEVGRAADFVIMDMAQHSPGKNILHSVQLGDLPGIGMTIIDGIVRTQRSRNTPPATRVPEIVGH